MVMSRMAILKIPCKDWKALQKQDRECSKCVSGETFLMLHSRISKALGRYSKSIPQKEFALCFAFSIAYYQR